MACCGLGILKKALFKTFLFLVKARVSDDNLVLKRHFQWFCFITQSIQNKTIEKRPKTELSSDTQSLRTIGYYQTQSHLFYFFLSSRSQDRCVLLFPWLFFCVLHVDEFFRAIFPLFSMLKQRVLTNNKMFFRQLLWWCCCLAFALYLTELRQKESIHNQN